MTRKLNSSLARRGMQQTLRKQAFGSRFGITPIRHRCAINVGSARHLVKNAARILGPSFFMVVFALAAHAQNQTGSIDFSPVTNVGTSIVTLLKFVGSAMAVGGLIYSAFEWFGRHEASKALGGVVGAIIGAVIVGAATAWGTSTAGAMNTQAVQ